MQPPFVAYLDQLIGRALFVAPRPAPVASVRPAERVLTGSLLFSALRCLAQYVVLPFVLPLVGIASGPPLGILALLDLLAIGALVLSLRRFWQARHPRRWEYLALALAMLLVIAVFFWFDVASLAK